MDSLNNQVLENLIEKWTTQTRAQTEEVPHMPVEVLQGEAMDLAELTEAHFLTVETPQGTRLGLESVAHRSGVTLETATELRELQLVIGKVHSRYLVLLEKLSSAPIERAEELLSEFRSVLSFLLGDGDNPTGEEQLARLNATYGDAESHDALALALQGYAELAEQHRVDLDALGGFDVSFIEEALTVGQQLRQRSADRLSGNLAEEQRQTLMLRNRLINELKQKVNNVRRTFRFVFRAHPEIVRKAGSEYRRRKQRAFRNRTPEPAGNVSEPEVPAEQDATIG